MEMAQKKLLQQVLNEARERAKRGGEPLRLALDIDSTLVDVAPRIEAILNEFAQAKASEFPSETARLLGFRMQPEDYGFQKTLARLGLEKASQEFYDTLHDFWASRFFSNEYLHHDRPYEGSVEFVLEAARSAQITYLTGRDVDRMRIGTIKSFSRLGFPVAGPRIEFALKPHRDLEDAAFKRDFLRNTPGPTWFFDNEPENICRVVEACPHVRVVFFESVRLGDHPLPEGIPSIRSFRWN